jgi:hypothetical protein
MGAKIGSVLGDINEESLTEYQGSPNAPLWELKWCLCRVLRLLRLSSGRAHAKIWHAQE